MEFAKLACNHPVLPLASISPLQEAVRLTQHLEADCYPGRGRSEGHPPSRTLAWATVPELPLSGERASLARMELTSYTTGFSTGVTTSRSSTRFPSRWSGGCRMAALLRCSRRLLLRLCGRRLASWRWRAWSCSGDIRRREGSSSLKATTLCEPWATQRTGRWKPGRDRFVELLPTAKRRGDLRRDVRAVRWVRAKRQMGQLMGRKD